MRSLLVMATLVAPIVFDATPVRADRDLCARGTVFRGTAIDLDLEDADLHDVFRLLADVGRVNLVVPADVTGRVTLRLARVPWDQVACTVAATQGLAITAQPNRVLLVRRQPGRAAR